MTSGPAAKVDALVPRAVAAALGTWLLLAVLFVAAGGLRWILPPLLILPVTLASLLAIVLLPRLRRWVLQADPRLLIAVHLVRLVGAYFLFLWMRGQLPGAFAVPAGIGDLAVVAGALGLLLGEGPSSPRWRYWLIIWNVLALVDILLVLANGARIALADPSAVEPFRQLPLGLLPTFALPLILATHLLLFAQAARRAES